MVRKRNSDVVVVVVVYVRVCIYVILIASIESNAEIILLQEVRFDDSFKSSFRSKSQMENLLQLLSEREKRDSIDSEATRWQFVFFPAMFYVHTDHAPPKWDYEGVAVLSRHPIVDVDRLYLSRGPNLVVLFFVVFCCCVF
jgi:exonuclease III